MALLKQIPSESELISLIGRSAYDYWRRVTARLDALYKAEKLWSDGGKRWKYEYKYRRASKTLCALYARQDGFGFMIIFGGQEREKVEALKGSLAANTVRIYDEAQTYHDGKWVMFDQSVPIADIEKLLSVKRRPDAKD